MDQQPPSHTTNPQPPAERHRLDTRGAGATWGILKVANALAGLGPERVLEVIGSDPRLLSDLPPVLAGHGCRLLQVEEGEGQYRFLVQRLREAPPANQRGGRGRCPHS